VTITEVLMPADCMLVPAPASARSREIGTMCCVCAPLQSGNKTHGCFSFSILLPELRARLNTHIPHASNT